MNLQRRGIVEGYRGFMSENEDVLHIIFFCSFSRLVWAIYGLPWSALNSNSSCTEAWFRGVFGELHYTDWDFFLSILGLVGNEEF
ncbi:UNVERIFIED_CONTAM: hypothetical protein Sradi_1317100 [Sesamum radiatum]|uniref:Reverse transcriptase zinc-binding domain-containing protein n=1 Tax=Sesamum radiatum TaxID=300843 RepID=A0AAW2UUN0_SESRA